MELLTGPALASLMTLPGIGDARAVALAHHFRDWSRLLGASVDELAHVVGAAAARTAHGALPSFPPEVDLPPGVQIASRFDPEFPEQLRNIPDPPTVLWWKGTLPSADHPLLAIVGTRTPNEFGVAVTTLVASTAARQGVSTVSGLALGTDSIAAQACIDAGQPTWAVLGQGIGTLPDRGSRATLAERILATGGGLICEVSPQTSTSAHHIIRRNRLQSGLAEAVLIAQTGLPRPDKPAGTIYTAGFALEQGRFLAVAAPPPALQDDPDLAGNSVLTDPHGTDPSVLRITRAQTRALVQARHPVADLCLSGPTDVTTLVDRVLNPVQVPKNQELPIFD